MPSGAISRSAGPFTGAPPTIGLTATTRSRRATSTSRTPGTARIGPIEITGFDGQITIVSARVERLEHARRGPGALGAVEAHRRRTGGSARSPTNHSCIASSSAARPSRSTVMRVRTGSSVIGSERARRPTRPRVISAVTAESGAPARRRCGAEEVGREVLVAEPEPRGDVVAVERVERGERLALEAPALRGVRRAGERVGDRVEVGGDVQPVELVVVGGVHDRDDVARRDDADEPGEEPGGTDTTGEGREHACDPTAGAAAEPIGCEAQRDATSSHAALPASSRTRAATGSIACTTRSGRSPSCACT